MVSVTLYSGEEHVEINQRNQELILEKNQSIKKKCLIGLGILAFIIIVISLICAIYVTTKHTGVEYNKIIRTITLEDILDGTLNPESFNASWVSDSELVYRDVKGNVMKFNVINQTKTELLSANLPVLSTTFEIELSPDHKYLLVAHDFQKIFRHSYVAKYSIVNLSTKIVSEITANNETLLQYATWGPIGSSVVFVVRNNIYYRPDAEEKKVIEITNDGLLGHIYNGIPDWVYEEEVFSSNKAVWFSPDGKRMAYAKFNDTITPVMTIPVYGQPGNLQFQYPHAAQIRYPKPGTPNPIVTLNVVDLAKRTTIKMKIPQTLDASTAILSAVTWATNDILTAIWMNRVQNEAYIVSYEQKDKTVPTIVNSLKQQHGWLELFTPPLFNRNGTKFALILSQNQSGNIGSYRHITLISRQANAKLEPLTSGKFVVGEILKWDDYNGLMYYEANTVEDPVIKHVFSINVETKVTRCISCNVNSTLQNVKCLHNSAKFSANSSHYVLNCAGPCVPEISIFNENNKFVTTWETNKKIVDVLKDKTLPTDIRFNVTIDGGFVAQVNLKLPPNLDKSGDVKYPMLVNVYGGPDSTQVAEKFNLNWGSYLAANKSIIYASIDGRGSGSKGDKVLFSGYRKLGTVEIYDQINVTRIIQRMYPFVDGTRTAIWGWSYGGYASGMALAMDNDGIFKCAISVAPVTDWALYDSIYTERFMGLPTPDDNLKGYLNAQLLNKVEGLRDKEYFLIHGTLDDNVHYQQSMLLSKVLEENDILFRQQSYPDEDHGLINVRPHLYHSFDNFLDNCFINDDKR